jgi:thiamine biosynthesis lipoprotein
MDTIVTIEVLDTNETHALESIDQAFDEIYHVEELMSSYRDDSQLSILNTQGHLDGADPDFVYVLDRSKYYSRISDGAFDVTIKPILESVMVPLMSRSSQYLIFGVANIARVAHTCPLLLKR